MGSNRVRPTRPGHDEVEPMTLGSYPVGGLPENFEPSEPALPKRIDIDELIDAVNFDDQERELIEAFLGLGTWEAAGQALQWGPLCTRRVLRRIRRRAQDYLEGGERVFLHPRVGTRLSYEQRLPSGRSCWTLVGSEKLTFPPPIEKKSRSLWRKAEVWTDMSEGLGNMEQKHYQLQVKSIGEDGTFEGLASVYNVIDLGNDIVEKGAFRKTLQERGGRIKILWQHDANQPIGVGELTDSEAGLVIKGKLSLGVSKAKDVYELLKDRVVDGLSIGFEVVKDEVKAGVRRLKEIRLWEVSVVVYPMNEAATISAVKTRARDELLLQFWRELARDIRAA